MTALVQYDAALAALAVAVSADEVMKVRLEATGLAALARVAKNLDFEIKAARLRVRAEAKLGDMLAQAERGGLLHSGRRAKHDNAATTEGFLRINLREAGIDHKLSSHAQRLNGIGESGVDGMLELFEQISRKRGRIAYDVISAELAQRNASSRRRLAQELSDCAALKPTGRKFPVLYADPAWRRKAGIGNRAYENHYVTMTWEAILAMPVASRMLPDGWGFVWMPRAHLLAPVEVQIDTPLGACRMKIPLAWAIQIEWGFDSYSTCSVWTKTDDEFPDDHGTGLIFFDQDELLLVFKRGNGLPKPDTGIKFGSNRRERSGGHSAKPAYYRDMINAMTGNLPVLELFAREDDEHPLPPNFYTWGNQSKNTAELPPDDPGTGEIIESAAGPSPAWLAWGNEAESSASNPDEKIIDLSLRDPETGEITEPVADPPSPDVATVEPASASPTDAGSLPNDDGLDIPPFLRIGHPAFMKRGTGQDAAAFAWVACSKIRAALRSIFNDPSAKELSPETISIAVAAATLALSPISDADMDGYIEHLPNMVRDIRAWGFLHS